MWANEDRGRYDRSKLRYPSDLIDNEWLLAAPLIPPAQRGGNKRTVEVREIVNGLMYILSTGCQWAALPKDLPARSTLHDCLDRWEHDGTLERIHHALYVQCRDRAGRDARTSQQFTSPWPPTRGAKPKQPPGARVWWRYPCAARTGCPSAQPGSAPGADYLSASQRQAAARTRQSTRVHQAQGEKACPANGNMPTLVLALKGVLSGGLSYPAKSVLGACFGGRPQHLGYQRRPGRLDHGTAMSASRWPNPHHIGHSQTGSYNASRQRSSNVARTPTFGWVTMSACSPGTTWTSTPPCATFRQIGKGSKSPPMAARKKVTFPG